MKNKLINYQIWLFVLIISSSWVVASVGLEICPLIPTNFSETFVLKLNVVLLNISYSILAAYIFYWFTYLLPRKTLIYRSKRILSQQVHWLLYELFVVINQILYAYDLNKPIEQIEEKDLRHLDGDVSKTFNGFYATGEHWKAFWKSGQQFTGFGDMPFAFPEDISKKLTEIPKLIHKIRQANPNFYTDEIFAEILSSIETNKIIDWYSEGKNKIFLFGGSSTQMFSLICDYKRLLNLKYYTPFHDTYHTIRFYTQEEINNIPQKKNNYFNKIAPILNVPRTLIPCIVYKESYYDSRSIISELNGGHIVTSNGFQKEFLLCTYNNEIQSPKNSRCVVIINELISKRQIREYIKFNQKDKVIICIKSNLLFTSKKNKFTGKSTTYGLYTIYYRKPLILFGFQFFRKYPTKTMIDYVRFNVNEIMRNFKEHK
jgi:hypothetical protein